MPRLILLLLMQGASLGCAMAALGLALYAGSPSVAAAAQLFGALGFGAGLLCGGLHWAWAAPTRPAAAALPPEALAALLRQTLASTAAARTVQPRRPERAGDDRGERRSGTGRTTTQAFGTSVFGA